MIALTARYILLVEKASCQIFDVEYALIGVNNTQKKIVAEQELGVQVYVILLIFIGFLVASRSIFTQSPEVIGERTIGKLLVDDEPFAREVDRTI